MKDLSTKGFYGAQCLLMGLVLATSTVKGGATLPEVAFAAAFGAAWPLILYCAATHTDTWWANFALTTIIFAGITPGLIERARRGWYSHNEQAIGWVLGAIVFLGMTGSLIYSIALMRPAKKPKADE